MNKISHKENVDAKNKDGIFKTIIALPCPGVVGDNFHNAFKCILYIYCTYICYKGSSMQRRQALEEVALQAPALPARLPAHSPILPPCRAQRQAGRQQDAWT